MAVIRVFQDEPVRRQDRLRTVDGAFIKSANVDSVEIQVFDRSSATPNVAVFSDILTGAAQLVGVVFDTLQGWDVDIHGFNFSHTLGTNDLVKVGGRRYSGEITIRYLVPTNLGTQHILYDIYVRPGVTTG